MTELLPCPFCGGEASYEYRYDDYNHDCIVCHNDECGASLTCWPYEGEKVTAAWNRRAKPDAAPVVRGEWINTYADDEGIGDFVKHCSVCCNAIIKSLSASLNYCPNCGAKMESEA